MEVVASHKITPNYAVEFNSYIDYFRTIEQEANNINLRSSKQYLSDLSEKSRKRLLYYLSVMYLLAKENYLLARQIVSKTTNNEIQKIYGIKYKKPVKFRLAFITLTLPSKQIHSDTDIKRNLLKQFLQELQKKFKMYLYIWKAEKQKNGNIHFHIITNRYIPYKKIREIWNRIIDKKGYEYVKKYSEKMQEFFKDGFRMLPNDKRSKETQYKAYVKNKAIKWTDPNTTDIHSVYKINNINAYFVKYVSKFLNEVSEVDEINEIIKNIRKCDIEIYKIRKDEYYSVFNEKMNMDIAKLETEKQNLLDKLNKYKNLLIEGRIWDASAILKKMKPISDYGMMQTIDEFNKDIDKIRYKTIEGSFDKIAVFWFNLNETPNIRKLLINHYAKQLAELKNNNLALDIF